MFRFCNHKRTLIALHGCSHFTIYYDNFESEVMTVDPEDVLVPAI